MIHLSSSRIKVHVNTDSIRFNFNQIKSILPKNVRIMCVVKADAYGLGATYISSVYEKIGADALAVATIDEALALRKNNISLPILILGYTSPEHVDSLAKFGISQNLFSIEYAKKINNAAISRGLKIDVHIKIDTGMSRLGFFFQDKNKDKGTLKELQKLSTLSGLNVKGIFTHFLASDEKEDFFREITEKQVDNFNFISDYSKIIFKNLDWIHCSNSGAILCYPESLCNCVRAGIILYGCHPSKSTKSKLELKEVLEIKTRIVQLKTVPANTLVSYGATFITNKKTKIATIPIGYADGLSRELSNKGRMLVKGKFAPIIGRICMDQCMLDVTNIENVHEDDEVTVLGRDGNNKISVDDIAQECGTINYEVLCRFKNLRSC